MYDANALALISQLRTDVGQLQQMVSSLQTRLEKVAAQAVEAETRSAVLFEVLAESGQLDTQELQARIEAAAIARRHEVGEVLADSQSAWDALGKQGEP